MPVVSLRPSADVSVTDWETGGGSGSNLYAEIDETSVSSADYIATEGGIAKFELTNPSAGIVAATMRVRFRKDGADESDLTVRLLQGDDVIAEWEFLDIADTDTDEEVALTSPQFALITNPSALRVEFEAAVSDGALAPPLDGLTGITGQYSLSRGMTTATLAATKYNDSSGAITAVYDQLGTSDRHFTDGGGSTRRPTLTTGGPNSIACADFDGSSDVLATNGAATVHFVSSSSAMLCISCIIDAYVNNDGTVILNDCIFVGESGTIGLHGRNTGGGTIYANNHDGGGFATPSATLATGVPVVLTCRHYSGNVWLGINGVEGTPIASGNTGSILTGMQIGGRAGTTPHANMKAFEWFMSNDASQDFSGAIANMMTHMGPDVPVIKHDMAPRGTFYEQKLELIGNF